MMSMLTLPSETLFHLYCTFLEAREIVLLEGVCRDLLIFSRENRSLWLSILNGLDLDHAPVIPFGRDVSNLSTEDLRRIVIKATRAFENWHYRGGPRFTRKVVFTKEMLGSSRSIQCVRLSSEGRYLFVARLFGTLECWDVESQELVLYYNPFPELLKWNTPRKSSSAWGTTQFAYSFHEEEQRIVIFAVSTSRTQFFSKTDCRDTLKIEEAVILLNAPKKTYRIPFKGCFGIPGDDLHIDGDYVLVRSVGSGQFGVFNWRKGQVLRIYGDVHWRRYFTIVKNHLITVSQLFVTATYLPPLFASFFGKDGKEKTAKEKDISTRFENIEAFTVTLEISLPGELRSSTADVICSTFTDWKKKDDRHLFIRLCVGSKDMQILTVMVRLASETQEKPVVTLEGIGPSVSLQDPRHIRTNICMGMTDILSSGRCLAYQRDRRYAYLPFRLSYRTSFWALASQERFDLLREDSEDSDNNMTSALTAVKSKEDDISESSRIKRVNLLELDDSGTALFFGVPRKHDAQGGPEDISIYFLN